MMDLIGTEALAHHSRLTESQLAEIRGSLRVELGVVLEHKNEVIEQLGQGPEPSFGTYTYHSDENLVKKWKYWTTDMG